MLHNNKSSQFLMFRLEKWVVLLEDTEFCYIASNFSEKGEESRSNDQGKNALEMCFSTIGGSNAFSSDNKSAVAGYWNYNVRESGIFPNNHIVIVQKRGFLGCGDGEEGNMLAKVHEERRGLGYSPEQLFAVVAAVDLYEDFVPWCHRSEIIRHLPDGSFDAELEIVSYTVVLSSMVTVPRLQPSIGDVHYLQKTNATVGCNGVGFIPRYLMHTLKFKEENIERIGSISDYKEYFEQGKIAAAFFVGPHAKLFLANNCKSFAIANINLALGGFAFEQQIAIQMAVNEFNQLSNCSKLSWYIKDLNGTSSRAASTGGQTVPKERRLKIGVPERAAVKEFVSVRYDQEEMKPFFSGFSVEVFEAAAKSLSHFPYDFFPFRGTYDEMLIAVYNKSLDAAVADISILDDRYDYADFSQPYMDSQIVMVVPVKNDLKWQRFIALKAFQWKLWVALAASSLFTGAIIYFNEYVNDNPEFGNSFPQIIGSIIWFSVTLLSFAQRESIKNNLSRLVLAICSMMTMPMLQPSIGDVHYLQKTNATVGCNGVGFIPRYLTHTLKFKEENIEGIGSISDYKEYFEQGKIAAAFFVSPHAKLFLANNSKSFAIANINLALGGFAYVRFISKLN
ncbi:unnamed protein product [Fraxinus pennsylvanica]|uniref:Ionotropic glutamate receptor C-terminal domain-containing protein n=1 Tax=Fraxinus pennsylvanica TaxID=56036 RepID=A0AAD1ZXS9_9LAMI|nr:unnamed protein product [Fraxinus pennsylvanica]